jgi:hypothetical protein
MQTALPPSLPVVAQVIGSTEQFAGEIEGNTIRIESNRGSVCRGRVDVGDMGYGSANVRCSDGRFGNFSVDIKGRFGSAYGRLGSSDVKITIG